MMYWFVFSVGLVVGVWVINDADGVLYSKYRREAYVTGCMARGETQDACRREAAFWQVYGGEGR